MNYDLMQIKKHYGEVMMHLCRKLFPTLLDEEGVLFNLLKSNFAFSRELCEDIINNDLILDFKHYIESQYDRNLLLINKDMEPEEILDEIGYDLYECKSQKDILNFKKYFQDNEMICTFSGNRLETSYVFFAVKKNVSDIDIILLIIHSIQWCHIV